MNREEKEYIKNVLKQTFYGCVQKFLTDVLPDNQDAAELSKNDIMDGVSTYIEKEVEKMIEGLEQQGINSMEDIEKKYDIVTEFVGKIEQKMENDAKGLTSE